MSLREREVSPWPIITFGDLLQSVLQVPLSVITLTAVRNRNYAEVYSVSASADGMMKRPHSIRADQRGYQGHHVFISTRGICSLMDSRQEETNLTSKFKMQGPNTSKRTMTTIGSRKGRNHVLEGSQDFIWSHTCMET
jgi:hypothetical protein